MFNAQCSMFNQGKFVRTFIGLLLVLTGCASHRSVTPRELHRDSLVLSERRLDSIYVSTERLVDRTADTVYVRERQVEFRYLQLHDTLFVTRIDSIPYEVRVTEYRSLPLKISWKSIVILFLILLLTNKIKT